MRWLDKIKIFFRPQGLPKYQNLYLGNGGGKLRVKNGGGIGIVKNCYYEPKLGSYIYWIEANGVMVTVPECNLEPINQCREK
jgi:hypothetical protein